MSTGEVGPREEGLSSLGAGQPRSWVWSPSLWAGVRSEVLDPHQTSVLLDYDGLGRAPPTLHSHAFIMQVSGRVKLANEHRHWKLMEVRIQTKFNEPVKRS